MLSHDENLVSFEVFGGVFSSASGGCCKDESLAGGPRYFGECVSTHKPIELRRCDVKLFIGVRLRPDGRVETKAITPLGALPFIAVSYHLGSRRRAGVARGHTSHRRLLLEAQKCDRDKSRRLRCS